MMGDVTFNITNPNMSSELLAQRVRAGIDEWLAPYDDQTQICDEGVVFRGFNVCDAMEHHAFETSVLADMALADIYQLLLYCRDKDKIIADGNVLDLSQLECIAIERHS